jgi:hypothetical protein
MCRPGTPCVLPPSRKAPRRHRERKIPRLSRGGASHERTRLRLKQGKIKGNVHSVREFPGPIRPKLLTRDGVVNILRIEFGLRFQKGTVAVRPPDRNDDATRSVARPAPASNPEISRTEPFTTHLPKILCLPKNPWFR